MQSMQQANQAMQPMQPTLEQRFESALESIAQFVVPRCSPDASVAQLPSLMTIAACAVFRSMRLPRPCDEDDWYDFAGIWAFEQAHGGASGVLAPESWCSAAERLVEFQVGGAVLRAGLEETARTLDFTIDVLRSTLASNEALVKQLTERCRMLEEVCIAMQWSMPMRTATSIPGSELMRPLPYPCPVCEREADPTLVRDIRAVLTGFSLDELDRLGEYANNAAASCRRRLAEVVSCADAGALAYTSQHALDDLNDPSYRPPSASDDDTDEDDSSLVATDEMDDDTSPH